MKTSESINTIAPALVKAQAAIEAVVKDKTGTVQKDGKNLYSYKYSDLASVIEHVKPPLNANGIAFLQVPGRADGGVSVTTRLVHESGEWIEGDTFIPCTVSSPQVFGSAITYAKRYGLQAIVGLPSEDDDAKKANDDAEQANREPTEQEVSDALMLLAEEAADGFGAVQRTMEKLRPPLQTYLRRHKKTELGSIKTAATKNAETSHAAH